MSVVGTDGRMLAEGAGLCPAVVVAELARDVPSDVALLCPGRPNGTYAELDQHVRMLAGLLRVRGIQSNERVALIVENGPEAASAFLGISAAAVCAPLNPSYRAAELAFYLQDLRARAVIVGSTVETPARDVARSLDIDVIELQVDPSFAAGALSIEGLADTGALAPPSPDTEALVLHTSGTTARPKIVPLTHRNLMASALNVRATLGLRRDDRCLNVMPLFHIHGLVAALLASLAAGSSVVCAPGFHQLRFFELLRGFEPTWFTAVPTMHQAILERTRRNATLVSGHTLRFARSSSAALPVSVLEGLEAALGVPVCEAYGMTETAHQMTSNPLPSGVRKPGSVGLPAGPEIAILDADGRVLPVGELGEVAVRGESVFGGYESNPDANAAAFSNGWFRTGDQGRLDQHGYLILTGRLKELINRAGEKVSPPEVDDALLRHPAVAKAVTFGMPHDRLGEEVAAAVVLRDGEHADERELQDHVAQTLAPFKVPRRIAIVNEIPTGATGKVQRLSLAEQLDLRTIDHVVSDGSDSRFLEAELRTIWGDVLGLSDVGAQDDFFALGGDSILASEAVARTRELVGKPDLPLVSIVRAPTPELMAAEIVNQYGWDANDVVVIQAGHEGRRPLFFVHADDGDLVRFAPLARLFEASRPLYAVRAPIRAADDSRPIDIPALAAEYLEQMRHVQLRGPYQIVGVCSGALVALEIAHRLEAVGDSSTLILVDPHPRRPRTARYAVWFGLHRARTGRLVGPVMRRLRRKCADAAPDEGPVRRAVQAARAEYHCRPTWAPTGLIRSETFVNYEMPDWYMGSVFRRVVFCEDIDGLHWNLFRPPAIVGLHEAISRAVSALESA